VSEEKGLQVYYRVETEGERVKELEKAFGRRFYLSGDPERMSYAWAVKVAFCCDEMEANWNRELIRFDFGSGEVFVSVRQHESWYDGGEIERVVPIRYCPWCGREIRLIRVSRDERGLRCLLKFGPLTEPSGSRPS